MLIFYALHVVVCVCFQYELLFCVHDNIDPAQKVVEVLMAKYPHIDARIFCGEILIWLIHYLLSICIVRSVIACKPRMNFPAY